MRSFIRVVVVAASTALMAVSAGTALAQTAQTTYSDSVQGLEYAAVSGESGSFLGQASGELPGAMNVTITYTGGSPGPNVVETITGGNWTLSGPWGEVFGSFSGGTVRWNATTTLADVVANMSVSGGSVNGLPISGGDGTFSGVLDHRPLAQGLPPTVSGTLRLTLDASGQPPPYLLPTAPAPAPAPPPPAQQVCPPASIETASEPQSGDATLSSVADNSGDYAHQVTPIVQTGDTGDVENAPSVLQTCGSQSGAIEPGGTSKDITPVVDVSSPSTINQSSSS